MIVRNAPLSSDSEPTWEIARLFPGRGEWTEGDFLQLNRQTNHLVELSEGNVEVLEMPTRSHQRILLQLQQVIAAAAAPGNLGETLIAPYPVRLWKGKFREPDVIFMLAAHLDRLGEDFADRADLVVEITSSDRRRDLETKREEYAQAGIAEYWIADTRERKLSVLKLVDGAYVTHSEAAAGGKVTSALLPILSVAVGEIFPSSDAPSR